MSPSASDLDILCIGEPLVEFAEMGRADERLYRRGFGGDTANVAVAAARQGARVGFATALGDDPFGREFLELFAREGIDHRAVTLEPGARTGLYFIHYGPDGHVFSYDRARSAASLMAVADLPRELITRSRVLQVSAISQAISSSCTDAIFAAMRLAKEAGGTVSYDTNLRLALWPLDRARSTINAALALTDIARPGLDDARQLTGLTIALRWAAASWRSRSVVTAPSSPRPRHAASYRPFGSRRWTPRVRVTPLRARSWLTGSRMATRSGRRLTATPPPP
jgi:2-dehydro-3-deoxygluconokinase